jgi:hypothetical protein
LELLQKNKRGVKPTGTESIAIEVSISVVGVVPAAVVMVIISTVAIGRVFSINRYRATYRHRRSNHTTTHY